MLWIVKSHGRVEAALILVCWALGECTGWVFKPLWHLSPSLQVLSWALGGWVLQLLWSCLCCQGQESR